MEQKRYRLLKDTYNLKAGLEITGKGIDGGFHYISDGGLTTFMPHEIENNPEWWQLIPESKERLQVPVIPIGATDIEVFHITPKEAFIGFKISNGNFEYIQVPHNPKNFNPPETNSPSPEHKSNWGMTIPKGPSLNADGSYKEVDDKYKYPAVWMTQEQYKKELDEYGSRCFNAAREPYRKREDEDGFDPTSFKYPTYPDYKSHIVDKAISNEAELKIMKTEQTPTPELIWFVNSYWEVHSKVKGTHHPADNDKNITVKDKEAGEKYVLENKPMLSINDFFDATNGQDIETVKHSPFYRMILEIAKQKLSNPNL